MEEQTEQFETENTTVGNDATNEATPLEKPGIRTFQFECIIPKEEINSEWKPAIDEYINYYNQTSQWFNGLLSLKVSDLISMKNDWEEGTGYYEAAANKKDDPVYKALMDIEPHTFNNFIHEILKKYNPEHYIGNRFDFTSTSYRKEGYLKDVLANYRTKMQAVKPDIEYVKLELDQTYPLETIIQQAAIEMLKQDIDNKGTVDDWNSVITRKEMGEKPNKATIHRLKLIRDVWETNKNDVLDTLEQSRARVIASFGGCIRRPDRFTMNIGAGVTYDMSKLGKTSYGITIKQRKKLINLTLKGNRQTVVIDNGQRCDIVDICNSHNTKMTFKLMKGKLYVYLSTNVMFRKAVGDNWNMASMDVNVTHEILCTQIKDNGNIPGYVNLYKALAENPDFMATCEDEKELEFYQDMARYVTYGLVESRSMFVRTAERTDINTLASMPEDQEYFTRMKARELAIYNTLKALSKKYHDENNHAAVYYVDSMINLRKKLKALYVVKRKRDKMKSDFDRNSGMPLETKEDKQAAWAAFSQTEEFIKNAEDHDRIRNNIAGHVKNMVKHAFETLTAAGYGTIQLEDLKSTNFKQIKMPTEKSLLEFHKLKGKLPEEWTENQDWAKCHQYFEMVLDDDGLICGFKPNAKWRLQYEKNRFVNFLPKAIGMADIKRLFLIRANNTTVNIVTSHPEISSQIDSMSMSILTEGKGKSMKPVPGHIARPTQERHRNGLLSGVNAAAALNGTFFNNDLNKQLYRLTPWGKTSGYREPLYSPKKLGKKGVFEIMKSTHHVTPIDTIQMITKPKRKPAKKKIEIYDMVDA